MMARVDTEHSAQSHLERPRESARDGSFLGFASSALLCIPRIGVWHPTLCGWQLGSACSVPLVATVVVRLRLLAVWHARFVAGGGWWSLIPKCLPPHVGVQVNQQPPANNATLEKLGGLGAIEVKQKVDMLEAIANTAGGCSCCEQANTYVVYDQKAPPEMKKKAGDQGWYLLACAWRGATCPLYHPWIRILAQFFCNPRAAIIQCDYTAGHLFTITENKHGDIQDICCRACCNPYHRMDLTVWDKASNSPLFHIDRPFKGQCTTHIIPCP